MVVPRPSQFRNGFVGTDAHHPVSDLWKVSSDSALGGELAGGIAFNCVANGKIFDLTPFERVFVQPAAGDGGLSVGAAFAVNHQFLGRPRAFVMEHAFWGPNFSASELA